MKKNTEQKKKSRRKLTRRKTKRNLKVRSRKKVSDKKESSAKNVVDSAFADKKNGITKNENKPVATVNNDAPVFKVQILASAKELSKNSSELKGLKNADFFVENGLYKYTVGSETDYNKILNIQKELKAKFPDCFIIAFAGNKKMSAKDALKLIK